MAHDAAAILYLQAADNLDSSPVMHARVLLGLGKAFKFQAVQPSQYEAAIKTLQQCAELGRQQYDDDLVAQASYEISACYFEMHKSGQMPLERHADGPGLLWNLALFQSCSASLLMRQKYIWACPAANPAIFALRL